MALIEVNHRILNNIADSIDAYCEEQDTEIKKADAAIATMFLNGWKGSDARAFAEKWLEMDNDGSVTEQFKKSLRNYGECLRACAKEYSKAQADSYNAARKLPRW